MLTIQPNITHSSKVRALPFKGENKTVTPEREDAFYQDKTQFYENQIKDLDKSLNDEKTPDAFKKIIKGFKIISEGLLEGWAVAWGASKGSRVVKSSVVKTIEKEGSKVAQEVLTPFGSHLKNIGAKFFGGIASGAKYVKNSKFAQTIGEKFSKIVEKIETNKVGKYIVDAFRKVGNFISDKIITPLKGIKAGEMYDKAAKATSTTLGVGAGAAGAYNASGRAENVKSQKETLDSDDLENLDDDQDLEDIGE